MKKVHGPTKEPNRLPSQLLLRSCIAASIALAACGPTPPPPPPPPQQTEALLMLLRPGPATWFADDQERGAGIDYELAQLFAKEHGLALKILASANPEQQLVDGAQASKIAGGGTYRPAAAMTADGLLYSSIYHSVYPVLIYNVDGYKPESWK